MTLDQPFGSKMDLQLENDERLEMPHLNTACISLASMIFSLIPSVYAQSLDEQPEPSNATLPIVRPLPGQLDSVEMFNSNSPEVVKGSGILVSTFPSLNMAHPDAHLNLPLNGEVNFFLHHINNRVDEKDLKTVHIALLVYNSSDHKANVKVLSSASHLSQPDAPFISLPAFENNDRGDIWSGPGDRAMSEVLRGKRDEQLSKPKIEIGPHQYGLLLNQAIPVDKLVPPINGRSALIKIETDQPLFAATLSSLQNNGDESPSPEQWQQILQQSDLVTPREKAATEPEKKGSIIYGRVAGVQKGSLWLSNIVNSEDGKYFDVADIKTLNFPISTVPGHTFDTGQVQSAPLVVRNADTAYLANGNYAVHYSLRIPLRNQSSTGRLVTIAMQNPYSDTKNNFYFLTTPSSRVFFRGSVKVTSGTSDKPQVHFFHLVLHQGESGEAIFSKEVTASATENVQVDLYYPPDATPPQTISIESVEAVKH
jgi:hypothetical protein